MTGETVYYGAGSRKTISFDCASFLTAGWFQRSVTSSRALDRASTATWPAPCVLSAGMLSAVVLSCHRSALTEPEPRGVMALLTRSDNDFSISMRGSNLVLIQEKSPFHFSSRDSDTEQSSNREGGDDGALSLFNDEG